MKTALPNPPAPPLLDAAASALLARPLRSWPTAARERLRERILALHRDWAAEWLPGHDGGARAPEILLSEATGEAEDQVLWSFAVTPRRTPAHGAPLAAIVAAMFGADNAASGMHGAAPPRIADGIALDAWNDWLRRLGDALGGFTLVQQDESTVSHAWSGGLQALWPWCGGTWTLVLPYDAVAAIAGPVAAAAPTPQEALAPMQALDRALADEPITLHVLLDGAELNLGQLQGLRIDDVVPLAHRLDTPARVVGPDGAPVCEGWLGQSNGRIAIELARPDVPAALPKSSPEERLS